ncbi:uncharacterized protein OCT59_010478 [Rhizophagus irregularis]|nr:hypothetical protein OCT59_010478 [Rhizophagus irregularis]
MTINEAINTPKRKQTMQGQVTASKSLKSKSAINTPMSSSPPSPKPKRTYTHNPRSKSLTLRTSPKKDLEKSEFMFSSSQFDDKDTTTTTTTTTATESIESLASPVHSDQTNLEESDPNSASIITSPTQSLGNHESIEQAIKSLEEKIKLDQQEHAIRILSRQIQQPEYKDDVNDPNSSGKKSIRSNTVSPRPVERKPLIKPKAYSYGGSGGSQSYGNPQRSQPVNNESQRKASISSIKPKNLCTCGDADSFWCQVCENRRFKSSFPKWTSGNKIIDTFIQETQLTTAGPFNYLEWIPFERFRHVKSFGEGGYGTLSTATWLDGPRSLRDEKIQTKWKRDSRKKVMLKFLRDSEHITQEFLNEFAAYYKRIAWDNCMLQCYGISQDPSTKNYIIVQEYAEHEGTPQSYIKLMEQCWDPDPSKRPSAESLHRTLYDWAKKVVETPKLPYKVNTEFAFAEQWRVRTHPHPSTSTKDHPEAKYTSQVFDFHDLGIPDMEEVACDPPDSEHAQSELSQSPSAESVGSNTLVEDSIQKCKSPDKQLMNDTISQKILPNEKQMEFEF